MHQVASPSIILCTMALSRQLSIHLVQSHIWGLPLHTCDRYYWPPHRLLTLTAHLLGQLTLPMRTHQQLSFVDGTEQQVSDSGSRCCHEVQITKGPLKKKKCQIGIKIKGTSPRQQAVPTLSYGDIKTWFKSLQLNLHSPEVILQSAYQKIRS